MRARQVGNSQLRSFGLIVAAGFAVIAVWPTVFHSRDPRTWALIMGFVLSAMALVAPPALRPFHRVWMTVGEALGWLNSRIILSVVYYLLIFPIGAVRRLSGSDPMRRQFEPDADTYRIRRVARPASHMQRQY